MIPVLEDEVLAKGWAGGAFNMDSLLSYSAVCGTGLDTVPLPGDVTVEQLASIYGDVASLAWKWNKPLSGRLLPMKGLKAGDVVHFTGMFLSDTKLQALP